MSRVNRATLAQSLSVSLPVGAYGIAFGAASVAAGFTVVMPALVGRPGTARADILVTAWHCLEFYHDLSRPILFSLPVKPDLADRNRPGMGQQAPQLLDVFRSIPVR